MIPTIHFGSINRVKALYYNNEPVTERSQTRSVMQKVADSIRRKGGKSTFFFHNDALYLLGNNDGHDHVQRYGKELYRS